MRMGATTNNSDGLTLSRPWTASRFDRLKKLLQQTVELLDAIEITENALLHQTPALSAAQSPTAQSFAARSFILVAATEFSALAQADPIAEATLEKQGRAATLYRVSLTFEPDTIAKFLDQLSPQLEQDWQLCCRKARSRLQPNTMQMQTSFTRHLLDLVLESSSASQDVPELAESAPAGEQASGIHEHLIHEHLIHEHLTSENLTSENLAHQTSLQQQIEQERLLNQVTTQIRQSLDLPRILQAAVDRVRESLQVDRLVIYQIDVSADAQPDQPLDKEDLDKAVDNRLASRSSDEHPRSQSAGAVVYEARASETIPSVLDFSDAHCFVAELRGRVRQTWDCPMAVEDVAVRYHRTAPCLLEFLQRAQVRAKLVAPIWVQNHLWGLLIAHNCTAPHCWQEREQQFLQQIAEHLAIAVQQAQLYSELQQQKKTLEQRVAERTQALQDSILAAQAANQAKSEFLAAVSHELRTPLACIIGMSTTLQRWSADLLDERQQRFLQMIHDSGEQLLAQVEDILALSQAEAGKMALNLREVSLSHLVQQVLKMVESQAALRQVEIELDLHLFPQTDRLVIDPQRVRQILFNLLSNAVKFTPAGGNVTLRAFVEKSLVMLQIKDTGIGIPEHLMPQLFQKFHQLDRGYGRQHGGTGVGLVLTKQLVNLHGGWIDVESTVGVGSVFTVCLPVLRLNDTRTPIAAPSPIESRRGRIILIEHREDIAEVICDTLTAAGYQVVWMLEGAMAVGQIEIMRPFAVVADVDLPDMQGETLIRQLRRNPGTKQFKFVALGPSSAQKGIWQAIGADDLLHHPVKPEQLLRVIMQLGAKGQITP